MNEEPWTPAAGLLRDFLNTLDYDRGTDALPDARALTAWLRAAGLLARAATATDDDLELARLLRDGLRAVLSATASDRDPQLDRAAAALPLRVAVLDGEPRLEPVEGGVRGALAALLVAVDDCRVAGEWSRLKICPADDCRWAFYDASRNRTRVWCAMGVCGNRTKTRAYRARHRETGDRPPGISPS